MIARQLRASQPVHAASVRRSPSSQHLVVLPGVLAAVHPRDRPGLVQQVRRRRRSSESDPTGGSPGAVHLLHVHRPRRGTTTTTSSSRPSTAPTGSGAATRTSTPTPAPAPTPRPRPRPPTTRACRTTTTPDPVGHPHRLPGRQARRHQPTRRGRAGIHRLQLSRRPGQPLHHLLLLGVRGRRHPHPHRAADLTANATGLVETWTRQAITDGGTTTWRKTETDTSYDTSPSDADLRAAAVHLPPRRPVRPVPADLHRHHLRPAEHQREPGRAGRRDRDRRRSPAAAPTPAGPAPRLRAGQRADRPGQPVPPRGRHLRHPHLLRQPGPGRRPGRSPPAPPGRRPRPPSVTSRWSSRPPATPAAHSPTRPSPPPSTTPTAGPSPATTPTATRPPPATP